MAIGSAGTAGGDRPELASGATWRVHGSGAPVTLVVHGLGATEGEARIPASGLRGTRVVLTLPGHGGAADPADGYWSYERVADDVLEAADQVGAERAVGVSLGAGALTRIAARNPVRFERLVLLLPAALDQPRGGEVTEVFDRLAAGVAAAAEDDGEWLRAIVGSGLPGDADVGHYVEQRAATLRRLGPALRTLPRQAPLDDSAELSAVASPALVIGAASDPLHDPSVAEGLAAVLPDARLEVFDSAAPMLDRRPELRKLLTGFLNDR